MKQFFDYAGNEIKEGQEIVIVKILDRIPKIGWFIPATGESHMSAEVPDKECWEVGEGIKIIVLNEIMELGFCVEGKMGDCSFTGYDTLSTLKWDMSVTKTAILAIKGISDSKDYYDLWKQNKSYQKIL